MHAELKTLRLALQSATEAEETTMKPAVRHQGTVIIETDGIGFFVMFPDGCIVAKNNKTAAERAAKRWFEKNIGREAAIGVGNIEWR
jgi:hypothetical protein